MNIQLSEEQQGFIKWFMTQESRCSKLIGYAGTGKTTVLKELQKILPDNKTMWCCPTHAAMDVLSSKLYKPKYITTIASALGLRGKTIDGKYSFVPTTHNKINMNNIHYLIIDESSMIGKNELEWILDSNAKQILFVGDDAQIPPVDEIISPIFTMNCDFPEYRLNKIYRQGEDSPIISLASDCRQGLGNTSSLYGIKTISFNEKNIIDFYKSSDETGIVLCPTHTLKDKCNKWILNYINGSDDVFFKGANILLESNIDSGIDDFDVPNNGEIVEITSNIQASEFLGFIVLDFKINNKYDIRVPINELERKKIEKRKKDLLKEYYNKETRHSRREEINKEVDILSTKIVYASAGYSMTLHKSQGQTINHVLLVIDGLNNFRKQNIHVKMVYTGITRAAKTLTLCK